MHVCVAININCTVLKVNLAFELCKFQDGWTQHYNWASVHVRNKPLSLLCSDLLEKVSLPSSRWLTCYYRFIDSWCDKLMIIVKHATFIAMFDKPLIVAFYFCAINWKGDVTIWQLKCINHISHSSFSTICHGCLLLMNSVLWNEIDKNIHQLWKYWYPSWPSLLLSGICTQNYI